MFHENMHKKKKVVDTGYVKTTIFQTFRGKVHVLLNVSINKMERQ